MSFFSLFFNQGYRSYPCIRRRKTNIVDWQTHREIIGIVFGERCALSPISFRVSLCMMSYLAQSRALVEKPLMIHWVNTIYASGAVELARLFPEVQRGHLVVSIIPGAFRSGPCSRHGGIHTGTK